MAEAIGLASRAFEADREHPGPKDFAGFPPHPDPYLDLPQLQAQLQAEEDERFLKVIVEVQTKTFERNAAYNNALLAAGYAGAFTIWSFTKSQIPENASIAVALALVVSLTVFITFEVAKMFVVGRHISKHLKVVNGPSGPTEKREAIKAVEATHARVLVGFRGFWALCLFISVAGALIAVGLLLYNFVAILLKLPGWPA